MFKKFSALVLVAALVCMLCGPKAFAQTPSVTDSRPNKGDALASEVAAEGNVARSRAASLKEEIQKLVTDARAGEGLAVINPQQQPRQNNNFSKAAKIGLVVGIAVAVVIVILVVHAKNNLFDDDTQIFR